jgi:hypothetical protein
MRYLYLLAILSLANPVLADKDKPEIEGQKPLTTIAGTPITIQLSDLIVDANDSDYPEGFYVVIYEGHHYTYSGNTITPRADFSGMLKVEIRVSDGDERSKKFDLKILVIPRILNAPPVITGQQPLATTSGSPVTLKFADLLVEDPDNIYPNGFSIIISPGSNYGINGNTITPNAGFNGLLTVPIKVNDGIVNSAPFDLKIAVNPVAMNAPPVITGQVAINAKKNESVTIVHSQLTVTDPDDTWPEGFTLKVLPGDNYTVADRTVTPITDFIGILTVKVRVNDGESDSETFDLKITISDGPVSNKPVITGQAA